MHGQNNIKSDKFTFVTSKVINYFVVSSKVKISNSLRRMYILETLQITLELSENLA